MMTPDDVANMADFIAQAVHSGVADEGESWGDLTKEEQDDFRIVAHRAMAAHDAWLTIKGWMIVQAPPPRKAGELVKPEPRRLIMPGMQ